MASDTAISNFQLGLAQLGLAQLGQTGETTNAAPAAPPEMSTWYMSMEQPPHPIIEIVSI